jgi:aminopeptidase-like protein
MSENQNSRERHHEIAQSLADRIDKMFIDLFPINRSLTGHGVRATFNYLIKNHLPEAQVKSVQSGNKVFDWTVPDEWEIFDAFVINAHGEKIIDLNDNNLHVISYSSSVDKVVTEEELLAHLHTLTEQPDKIPYRTSYYKRDWGFCCAHDLLNSDKFIGPFKVFIDAKHHSNGNLEWLECIKRGSSDEEILISTYCCHPNLANDNLSGCILAVLLFEYMQSIETKYTYRLLICPETIGAIAFLSQANTRLIKGGLVVTCVAGPGQISIKQGFDTDHFINKAAHLALQKHCGKDYHTYPFVPDGSDERQYSSPGFRIVTPSIHKSKYYEFKEYHTSGDNLEFVSAGALEKTLDVHKSWVQLIETYCYPNRINKHCEFQLGKRDLYPNLGGTLNQLAHVENLDGNHARNFDFGKEIIITGAHLDAFHWLMHLADGSLSNFDIAERSGIYVGIVNDAIIAMYQKGLLGLK